MPARPPGPRAQCTAWLLMCVLVGFAPPGVTAFSLPGASAPTPTVTPTAEWSFAEQRRGRQAAEERCAAFFDILIY